MESIKLSDEKKAQIKDLWNKYKLEAADEKRVPEDSEINALMNEWDMYREKIINNTLSLEEYTNKLENESASMPGGYLCNFLERKTSRLLGSSKPGNADNFGVKLNDDNHTYHIKSEKQKNANKDEAEEYFNQTIKPLLKSILDQKEPMGKVKTIVGCDYYSAKQILMKMAVLEHLDEFIYIYSNTLNDLYDVFFGQNNTSDDHLFAKNYQLCLVAKELFEVDGSNRQDMLLLSAFLWEYSTAQSIADEYNPNVILYGPPGTGKTYSVMKSLDFVCQGDSSRYEVLQFHPSFSYEDFIEGIKPKGVSKDGNIRFELVNGIFKNFCIKAKNNPSKPYYFIVDEINRANLSSVFGETLSLLERSYRHDNASPHCTKNTIKTQYSALINDLISEDEKYKKLAYVMDGDEAKFGIPNNIFFIGMMNDVDKSIDAFDLALRRRFKWIRKDCDYDVIEKETKFKGKEVFENIDKYSKACLELNKYIENTLGLGKSYEFGHSFFMNMSTIAKNRSITGNNMESLFDLYLRPTLKEYLRAIFSESEIDEKLKETSDKFKKLIK